MLSQSDTTATTATADSEGAGVVPQPAGPNPNLSEAEVLVEGLALGSISGQLGPACIDVAGSVACSPKDEDRILLRTLGAPACCPSLFSGLSCFCLPACLCPQPLMPAVRPACRLHLDLCVQKWLPTPVASASSRRSSCWPP